MASTYSTNLRVELMANGENSTTWGSKTNTNWDLIEQAVSGVASVAMTDADYTLTTSNAAVDEARNAVVTMTGTLTQARNVIVPSVDKQYVFKNSTTGGFSIVVKTAAGTGITVLNGETEVLYCDATNVLRSATTPTGSGAPVRATSPALVAPVLDTPASGTLTNCTGLPSTGAIFTPSGTGAVATTVQAKLRESVSPADFGADGSGTETTEIQAALTAHDVVCVPGLTTYTSGALTSTGKTIKWPAGMYTVNSNLADPLVLSNLTGAPALTFTLESRHAHARYFGDVTANDIYDAIYPDVSNFDVSCNVLHLAASSSVITNSAVAGYVKSDAAAAAGGNGVALFGCGMASSNDAAVWGLNTLLQDDATRAVGTGTGRVLVGAEYDFNVMNTDTEVTGCSVGGNSLSAPAASNGYQVSPLGTGVPWGAGFVTQDAAATVGISIGMLATSGANVDSQPLYFSWTDSGSTKRTLIVDVVDAFMRFQSTGTLAGYSFQGANILLDPGKSLVVNGNGVVSDRVTGYTAMTGTANKNAVYDTATVSLAQLAGRVMQLQADLTTHGLIGA